MNSRTAITALFVLFGTMVMASIGAEGGKPCKHSAPILPSSTRCRSHSSTAASYPHTIGSASPDARPSMRHLTRFVVNLIDSDYQGE